MFYYPASYFWWSNTDDIYIDYYYFSRWLQKYRINPDYHVLGWEWNKPKSVPECLLSHLETFVWRRYDWKGEKEEEVATYLLKNARGLKNATFSTGPIEPGQLDKLKHRRRTRKKLDGVLKASNTCHLVFKFEWF